VNEFLPRQQGREISSVLGFQEACTLVSYCLKGNKTFWCCEPCIMVILSVKRLVTTKFTRWSPHIIRRQLESIYLITSLHKWLGRQGTLLFVKHRIVNSRAADTTEIKKSTNPFRILKTCWVLLGVCNHPPPPKHGSRVGVSTVVEAMTERRGDGVSKTGMWWSPLRCVHKFI
jgi:hypothetical protein